MDKRQGVVGSAGAAMFATFLTTAQMHFFSTPSRPGLVLWLMVGSGTAWVLCMVLWLYFHFGTSSSSPNKPEQSIATGGGNNSGHQFVAGRDVYIGAQPPPQPEPTPRPKQQQVQPWEAPPKPISTVEVGDVEWGRAMFQHNVWGFTENNGERCLAISVFNPPPPLHHRSSKINQLSAHLLFKEGNQVLANVAKAFWAGHQYNEISIEIGDRAYLVVATVENDVLTAMGNRYTAPHDGGLMFSRTIPTPTVDAMRVDQNISIEVTLLVNQTAIGKFCVDVRKDAEGKLLFQRNDQ